MGLPVFALTLVELGELRHLLDIIEVGDRLSLLHDTHGDDHILELEDLLSQKEVFNICLVAITTTSNVQMNQFAAAGVAQRP